MFLDYLFSINVLPARAVGFEVNLRWRDFIRYSSFWSRYPISIGRDTGKTRLQLVREAGIAMTLDH